MASTTANSIVKIGNPFEPTAIQGILTQHLAEKIDISRYENRMHGSTAGFCSRREVNFFAPGQTDTMSAAGKYYMAIGNAIHEVTTDALYNAGLLLFKEFKLPPVGLNMGSYIDAIAYLGGRIRMLEIKSCGKLPTAPKDQQREQALLYSALSGLPASMVYFSRNVADWNQRLQVRMFDLPEDEETLRSVLYEAVRAKVYGEARVLPPIPGHVTKSKCRFCPFKRRCWGDWNQLWPDPTPEQSEKLESRVERLVDHYIDSRPERRVGILKHIEKHGTEHAKQLLTDTDWSLL